MCSVNAADEEQRWVPTHVQVLVIRARGLRAKGKHGTSDAYTLMQLGKEKYSTCVVEKSTEPEWSEECSFELQPGVLEHGGRDVCAPGSCDLTLTVMHRALIGLDVFLGQAVIPLDKAFHERICMKNQWYKLHSKSGKKEKERGELQITVQFTRHNLTASMYDLSIKDKPRSAFGKLRDRIRAKKRIVDEESSSAIVPGGYGALARMRGRLPSDGGGEEDYEDDEGGELRRSKMRSFFLRGRLRKSSDTRSSTSLGSESSESSSRGGSLSPTAGISVVVSDLSNSPSNSSNLTADNSPEHTVAPSPQVSPVRHVFDDEPCDFSIPVPHSLTYSDTPILLPSVCVNGNPVETSPLTHQPPSLILQQPKPQIHQETTKTALQTSPPVKTKPTQAQKTNVPEPKPQPVQELESRLPKARPEPLLPALGLLQKGSALSLSLQNLSRRGEELQGGGPLDGRRWSFDKPGEEEKAAIAAALEHTGLISDEPEVEITVSESEVQNKKKRGLFSHGRGSGSAGKGPGSAKEETGHGQPHTEGKHRGWFSSKDNKPSQLVFPQADSSSSSTIPNLLPTSTDISQDMTHQHTNPFTSPPTLSPANPFYSHLQQNPFFEELCIDIPSTPALPSLFSPGHCQPEEPPSSITNLVTLSHLAEAGNRNFFLGEDYQMATNANKIHTSDDNNETFEKPLDWNDFISDRMKPSENLKIESEMNNLYEPSDPVTLCTKSGQRVSNKDDLVSNTTPACTLTVYNVSSSKTLSQHSGGEANCICSSSCSTDLNSFAVQEAPEFNFDSSLPQTSIIEFSELNVLACPYPALSGCSLNQDNIGAVSDPESQVPSACSISSNALSSSVTPETLALQDSLGLFIDKKACQEKSFSSQLLMDDDIDRSVETLKISVPSCKYLSSTDTLEHTIATSDSPDKDFEFQAAKTSPTGGSDVKLDTSIRRDEDIELNKSVFKVLTHLDGSVLFDPSGFSVPPDISDGMVMEEKDANEPGCMSLNKNEVSFAGETSLIDNVAVMTSSPEMPSNIPLIEETIVDWLPDVLMGSLKVSGVSGDPSEYPEVEVLRNSRQTLSVDYLHPLGASVSMGAEPAALNLNAALSPGSLLFHSLYTSADSEHYLTCRSQNNSLSTSELSQEAKPQSNPFLELMPTQKSILEIKDDHKTSMLFEDPKIVEVSKHNASDSTVFHASIPKSEPLEDSLEKCDSIKEATLSNITNEANIKCDPSVDVMLNHVIPNETSSNVDTSQMMASLKEDHLRFETQTCLVDYEGCPNEPSQSHNEQVDGSVMAECALQVIEVIKEFHQRADNISGSDFSSEQTSSITQDLVTTDLLLENIFIPQHTVETSPVEHPVPMETCSNMELCNDVNKTLNRDINSQVATTNLLNTVSSFSESSRDQYSADKPVPKPFNLEQLTLPFGCDLNQNFPTPLLEHSPLASSTPHVAEGTNAFSLSPFPKMPFTPLPTTVLAAASLPSPLPISQVPVSQETHQVSTHLSSPHPVKPLTPPDEKRSESRSVLEKLKSTIHPGRGHHGDQEIEKKHLVEGGGSYYHLNHSELVSLLVQRDAELQQEKEEYERRRMLLEKRDVDIKKMKLLIRDLEDYIDTLLVRIMEQTPTLLQVRPKMK